MAKQTSTWRDVQRKICKLLGVRCLHPNPGVEQADGLGTWLVVEVKHRKALPVWLESGLRQAERMARPDRLPILVVHQHRKVFASSVVMLRLSDWLEWFGQDDEMKGPKGGDE